MAEDSVELDNLQAGDDVATDLVATKHYQYVKLAFGADGTITKVGTTASDPLPVALSDAQNTIIDAIKTAVEGTLTVGSHAVTNAGTFDVQIADTSFAVADGNALGEGVLVQGDDGTDRKNINVDATTGDVQVDVTNTVTVTGTVTANAGTGTLTVDGSGVTQPVSGTVTANAGTGTMTVDGSGVTQPVSGTITANLSTTDNTVLDNIQTESTVSVSATGTTTFYDEDLDETEIEVDTGPVNIYSIQAFNTTAAPLFLQMWNTNTVTVGTTKPTNQYVIPGNADSDGAGFMLTFAVPKAYDTALSVACTTGSETAGAPGAGACIVNIEYAT